MCVLALGIRLNEKREKEQAKRQDSEPEWLEEGSHSEITVGKPVFSQTLRSSSVECSSAVVGPALRGWAWTDGFVLSFTIYPTPIMDQVLCWGHKN